MNRLIPEKQADFYPLNIYGDIRRITRIFFIFSLITLVGMLLGVLKLLLSGQVLQGVIVSACVLPVGLSIFFILKQKFEAGATLQAVVLFIMVTIVSTFGEGIHSLAAIAFPAILIIACLVTRRRTLVFLTFFSIACVAWLVFGAVYGWYNSQNAAAARPGDFASVAVMLIATALMVRTLIDALFQTSREVQKELQERQRAEERLAYDGLHDSLTGLPNRVLFLDRLGQRLDHSLRHPENPFVVLFIDLDRFKVINDSLGHAVGDQMLIHAARRLTDCLRPEDTVARLGGDEFGILMNDFNEIGDALHIAERVQGQLSSPDLVEGFDRSSTASIGIAIYNNRYKEPQELLRDADAAMYRAKAMGGGKYAIFDDTMHASAMALLQMEAELKHAVENRELRVYYQPIVELADRRIVGVEALLRWQHPRRGLILPEKFIHVAE